MTKKGDYSIPYMFNDKEMQRNFHINFFIRPIAYGRSFDLVNFSSLSQIVEVFEFQGWNEFLRIFEDIYTGLVGAFYSILASVDEDNTSLRSIIRSFEIQMLPSELVHITNTPNEGVLCRGGTKWWEQLEAIKEEVSKVLMGKRDIHVRSIRTSNLLITIRAVYSVV